MREVENRGILIVEGDRAVGEALVAALERQGYTVVCVCDGYEAAERLRDGALAPALVIVDLISPVADGRRFCAELRRDPELSGIPLLVIYADDRLVTEIGEYEPDGYMPKPLDMGQLLDTVSAHCPAV